MDDDFDDYNDYGQEKDDIPMNLIPEEEEENEDEENNNSDEEYEDDKSTSNNGSSKTIIDGPTLGIQRTTMTKYEYTRLLGVRISQIEKGSPPIKTDTKYKDVKDIAIEEIELGLCPINIKRIFPNGIIEVWYRRRSDDGTIIGLQLPKMLE